MLRKGGKIFQFKPHLIELLMSFHKIDVNLAMLKYLISQQYHSDIIEKRRILEILEDRIETFGKKVKKKIVKRTKTRNRKKDQALQSRHQEV